MTTEHWITHEANGSMTYRCPDAAHPAGSRTLIVPAVFNVCDRHGGFTALVPTGTLWRPGRQARFGLMGRLVRVERGVWQQHNHAVVAEYRLKGYRFPVGVWFCPFTGNRLDSTTQCTQTGRRECTCVPEGSR